ncbi:hypothetical protein ACFY9N_10620 [Microbacterium sp. NPDC008134]|uniref:hypothetical protein n=1 Tax=Microbacterium sp. NPDC008134 TaxID=3364183 RepID=UPI0036E2D705
MLRRRRETTDLRWLSARAWTNRWYPQGIDTGVLRGRRALAVTWFQQDRARTHLASRVVFIDQERARHIDVALLVPADDGALLPAAIHAGGLAWFEDRLFVAATHAGIWEFDLSRIRRVRRGWRTSLAIVRTRVHPIDLRCSFIGRAFDADGSPLRRVLIGEFRRDGEGRIGEFTIPETEDDGFVAHGSTVVGIPEMQGAVRWGDRYFVSQSDGTRPGTLWTGGLDALSPHDVALPSGCEDLALAPEERMLWTLGEHPRHRVVRGIPFARLAL